MLERKRARGFTLLSMGIALGVIGLLLGFTLPQAAATYDIYKLQALQKDLRGWAKIAQESGFALARFERCAGAESCLYKKFGRLSDCPNKLGAGNHYFSNGPCIYNLSDDDHRNVFANHNLALPARGRANRHNGAPIYLVHGDKRVEAFTCVEADFVEPYTAENLAAATPDSPYAGVCDLERQRVLFTAVPETSKALRRMLVKRLVRGGGDDFLSSF